MEVVSDASHEFFSLHLQIDFCVSVGDGQLEPTEKHEAEQFRRVFENLKRSRSSSGESTLASASEIESKLSNRLSELMPADYNPGFAFVVVQKRINTRIVTVNKRMPRVTYIFTMTLGI